MSKKYEIISSPDELGDRKVRYLKNIPLTGINPNGSKNWAVMKNHRNLSQLGTCSVCACFRCAETIFGDAYKYGVLIVPGKGMYSGVSVICYQWTFPTKLARFVRS